MAKKAPILDKNYNPIASRLKEFKNPLKEEDNKDSSEESKKQKTNTKKRNSEKKPSSKVTNKATQRRKGEFIDQEEEALLKKEKTIFIDDNFKLGTQESKKRCEIKFMCSGDERDRWHQYSHKITGKRNCLSNVIRSLLLILEDSEEQLEKVSEAIKEIQTPPRGDALKTILFEKKIANVIWEAVRRSSKIK